MQKTLILYHGGCPDGFGGAYAAWKKFGDAAEYVPLSRSEEPPVEAARGKDVYFIDFTYNERATMDRFSDAAERLVVLDHHEGVRAVTESMPEYVFDNERSGAGIAWDYFHPGEPLPALLGHVQDDDLFRFALPETKPVITYLEVQPKDFSVWDEIARKLDDSQERETMLDRAKCYREYFELLAKISIDKAKLVRFEGYEVYFANAHPMKPLKSLVGNELARKKGPIALVVSSHPEGYGVSIRSDGAVNVAEIAQKYGGNGHPKSAGFLVPREGPFPWEPLEPAYEE